MSDFVSLGVYEALCEERDALAKKLRIAEEALERENTNLHALLGLHKDLPSWVQLWLERSDKALAALRRE